VAQQRFGENLTALWGALGWLVLVFWRVLRPLWRAVWPALAWVVLAFLLGLLLGYGLWH
jgi:hypothetical protein